MIVAKPKERMPRVDRAMHALKRLLRRPGGPSRRPEPEHPDDPYALVGAPKRPRPPLGSLAVAVDPEKDY